MNNTIILSKKKCSFASFAILLLGLFGIALYGLGYDFPIFFSIALLSSVTLYLVGRFGNDKLGLLTLLFWLAYSLPFVHILSYLWFDFGTNPTMLWGLMANPYMVDEKIIKLTAMLGAIGGLGFAFGCSLSNRRIKKIELLESEAYWRGSMSMGLAIWFVWVATGFLLSVISAPTETVFTGSYAESTTVLDKVNFGSAWMLSYVMLTFCFCDAFAERDKFIKGVKILVVMAAIVIIVVFYQLMRGDRESLPWVLALIIFYYNWGSCITQKPGYRLPWLKICSALLIIAIISLILGALRSSLVGVNIGALIDTTVSKFGTESFDFDNILHGTWSAALLTPLSVAGDDINGLLPTKWGKDYIDLLLSVIPGFLADEIGYIRPIDGHNGPAFEMRYGLGGTHALVVPFQNFRMHGVFLILSAWGFLIVRSEKWAIRNFTVSSLSLLVILAMAAPHWFWYGEKYGLNALIIWYICKWLHYMSTSFRHNQLRRWL